MNVAAIAQCYSAGMRLAFVAALLPMACTGEPTDAKPATGIALYTLSRGGGVPEPTRDLLKRVRSLFDEAEKQQVVVALKVERIGLEGETRLCAEFRSRDEAARMLERVRELGKGVDLINIVEEPCKAQGGYPMIKISSNALRLACVGRTRDGRRGLRRQERPQRRPGDAC